MKNTIELKAKFLIEVLDYNYFTFFSNFKLDIKIEHQKIKLIY